MYGYLYFIIFKVGTLDLWNISQLNHISVDNGKVIDLKLEMMNHYYIPSVLSHLTEVILDFSMYPLDIITTRSN